MRREYHLRSNQGIFLKIRDIRISRTEIRLTYKYEVMHHCHGITIPEVTPNHQVQKLEEFPSNIHLELSGPWI